MRKLKTPLVTEFLVFVMLAVVLLFSVSVPSILANMFNSGSFYNYFLMAFSSTDFLVQTAIVLAVVTVLFFIRNIAVHTIFKQRVA
jgi:hypothetical protein